MKIQSLLIRGIAVVTVMPAMALAQTNGPARAAGSRSFAQWDKIEITVETKYGNNLAILHGSPKPGHHSPGCRRRPRHGVIWTEWGLLM